jgi:tetratricopeptide (TPR) repeat protein
MAELDSILDEKPDDLQVRFDNLEGALIEGAEEDSRLSSGTPHETGDLDLDFIQMTGLTRPAPEPGVAEALPVPLAPEADVIVASPAMESDAAQSLKDIISELTGEPQEIAAEGEGALEAAPPTIEDILSPPEDAVEAPLFVETPELVDPNSDLDDANPSLEEAKESTPESPQPEAIKPEPVTEPRPEVADPEPSSLEPEALVEPETHVEPEALIEPETLVEPATPAPQPADLELTEAQDLLQALEAQERDISGIDREDVDGAQEWDLAESDDEEDDSSVYGKPLKAGARRGRRQKKSFMRTLRAVSIFVVIAVVVTAAAFMGYREFTLRAESPEASYNRAASLMAQGRYTGASDEFVRYIRRDPNSPLRSEAQFQSAYALSLVPDFPADAAKISHARGVELFKKFIEDNPGHTKRARAETLLGVLLYRCENYEEAILILENRSRRLIDPDAYLPSLRVLGRAHARMGQIEQARSAFLRATDVEGNFSPDSDYLELAALYRGLGSQSQSTKQKRAYLVQAVAMWQDALKTPGLPDSRKKYIRLLVEAEADEQRLESQ